MNILYLAKAGYGGWASFTAHLAHSTGWPIYKITQRGEKKKRNFGWGLGYQNLNIEQAEKMGPWIIACVVPGCQKFLKYFKGNYLVIHDPTELRQDMKDYLPDYNVITIRESVHDLLLQKFNILSEYLVHPFINLDTNTSLTKINKKGAISVSRIDFDKNIDIIIETNDLIQEDEKKIEIYGCPNDIYVYHKLRKTNYKQYYKGKFDKSFSKIISLLKDKKYCVDMSSIFKDGGGSQYTFLEAINLGCCLILNKKWVENMPTKFINGHNCLIVDSPEALKEILEKDLDVTNIVENARALLKEHLDIDWKSIVSVD